MVKYCWRVVVALDQLLNAFLGGYPDETLSCRAYRKALAGQWFWRLLAGAINCLFFWQKKHCQKSFESEKGGQHNPAEFVSG